ncbi:MAG TPA: hypothetical protein VE783_03705 [Candidatus Limnocylindrales bacterium]|nr:hypothetical protein [Candidatus Limnocylindrales bacterium]
MAGLSLAADRLTKTGAGFSLAMEGRSLVAAEIGQIAPELPG